MATGRGEPPGQDHTPPPCQTTRPGEVATSHQWQPQTCPDQAASHLRWARDSDLVGVIVPHGRGTEEGHNGGVLSDEECLNILPRSIELLAANYAMDLQPVVETYQVMRLLVFTLSVCLFFSCSGNDFYVFS